MEITINGKLHTVADGSTVTDLLAELELEAIRVAVEINKELAPRATFAEKNLRPGDVLEIVTFVGGG